MLLSYEIQMFLEKTTRADLIQMVLTSHGVFVLAVRIRIWQRL